MCLISIIVPNYNHSKFLLERLDSIFNQTYQDFEVILLDDCSTDESVIILEKFVKHLKVSHLIVNSENSRSPFKQWRKGIELAKGDYIWIAESDDYCDYMFLEKLINFNNQNQLDVIYSQSLDIDENGTVIQNRIQYTDTFEPNIWQNNFVLNGEDFIRKYLKVKCVIPNASAVLFKRSLLNETVINSGFLNMKICGDWFFWINVLQHAKIGFYADELNYFRFHENVTRNQVNYSKIYFRCFEEKIIRDYLSKNYKINQEAEIKLLYEKWFRQNSFSKLLSFQFHSVRLKCTSIITYISCFFEIHKTREKFFKTFIK